jgi:7-cyano-7-deazaguanine synthase
MPFSIAYVLLSGGLDSTSVLAKAVHSNDRVRAVSIDYGQRHRRELESARQVSQFYSVPHEVIPVSIPRSMLTDRSIPVPHVSYSEITGVSPTYVPFRNGLMLSTLTSLIAGRHLDPTQEGSPDFGHDALIYWGAHADDAAGDAYPDCTVEFIGAMACAISIGTYRRVRMLAPFATMAKHEIVSEAHRLGAPLHLSWSCYEGGERHCGLCATCLARKEAFRLAEVTDPTEYAA